MVFIKQYALYGTLTFIVAFTTSRYITRFWASWVQSSPSHSSL